MSDAPSARAARRLAFVRAQLGAQAPTPIRASSDAGFRSYWRSFDTAGRSVIVMDSPPELEDARPWLRMQQLLAAHGVRVPAVRAHDLEHGLLLLEDLGRSTLLDVIDADSADAHFNQAHEQLLRIQCITPPADLPAYDEALIRRELELFPTWFLGRHLGSTLDTTETAALVRVFDRLVEAFLAQPQVLVHRDFMPRNLMPLPEGMAVLDFQDAVRGPITYDLVSCYKDAFLSWPQSRIDGWTRDYRDAAGSQGLAVISAEGFQRDFDLVGVQRHLKVLGIFARLHHRDDKPRYLADAPRFIRYLKSMTADQPELVALDALLDRHVLPRIAPLELPR